MGEPHGRCFLVDLMAAVAGNFGLCVEKIRAAIEIQDNAAARLHMADCLDSSGRLIDALREVVAASERAAKDHQDTVATLAGDRTQTIMKRLGRVKLEIPSTFGNLRVTVDDKSLAANKWATPSVVDPGEHRVRVEGVVAGTIMSDDQTMTLFGEGQTVVVKVTPVPRAIAPGQLECIRNATTEQQLQACVQKAPSRLTVRAAAEVSAYSDTQRVSVLSPAINAEASAPTREWSVGGSYLVDVVSAASADVASMASPRFNDTRHAGTLRGSYSYAPWTFMLNGALSSESDYLSRGLHGAVALDTFDKQFTPKVGYGITLDKIGRAGVPFDTFANSLTTHDVELTGTIILSRHSLLILGGSLQFEFGDQSKPYRYIPMFAPGTDVPNHASAGYVNAVRLPERPLEQLPLERDRYALLGKYIVRLKENATLRLEERVYTDNWGMFASSTEGRYLVDVSQRLRVWAGLRLHFQTASSFYARAYFAQGDSQGVVRLPIVRTTDRELGTLLSPSPTLGARMSTRN